MIERARRWLWLAAWASAACSAEDPRPPRVTVRFVDRTEASGLGGFQQVNGAAVKSTLLETFGAGVALLDIDDDGDLDVYLTNAGRELGPDGDGATRDALWVNDGAGRFTDVTAERGLGDTGWTTGVESADFDGDGRLDLFLTGFRRQVLYLQRADGTFEDRTAPAGLASERWSTGACVLDFDRDGDLDLYVANHARLDIAEVAQQRREWLGEAVPIGPSGLEAEPDVFYRNRGDGTFEDASAAVGIGALAHYGFEAVAVDLDDDGWVDVYVANDGRPNVLWRNVEGLRFEEIGERAGVARSAAGEAQAGMGVAVGDTDGDGRADLLVTNFSDEGSTLYRARGDGRFEDATARARLIAPTRPYLGWSAGFDDLDLDGDVDLWSVAGHVFQAADRVSSGMGYHQPKLALLNRGDGRFDLADDAGGGFATRTAGRGGAAGDLDGDGDLDLVLGNLDGPPTVLVNRTEAAGRAVLVRLRDQGPNTTAHGAVVTAEVGARRLVRCVGTGAGFLSSPPLDVHFGLGEAAQVDALVVRWPDGRTERYPGLAAGSHVVLDRRHGIVRTWTLGSPR